LTFIITSATCNTNKQTMVKNQCRFQCDLPTNHISGQLPCRKEYKRMNGWETVPGSMWLASHCYLLHHAFNLNPHWVYVLSYNSLVLQAGCVTVDWLMIWLGEERGKLEKPQYKKIHYIKGITFYYHCLYPSSVAKLLSFNYDPTLTLTYSMEQSPFWESNQFSATLEISCILWNPKVHYHIYQTPPPVLVLSYPTLKNHRNFCIKYILWQQHISKIINSHYQNKLYFCFCGRNLHHNKSNCNIIHLQTSHTHQHYTQQKVTMNITE